MGKLDGKVAIVTGARGLGRAYAKRLAGLGAKVAVASPPPMGTPLASLPGSTSPSGFANVALRHAGERARRQTARSP